MATRKAPAVDPPAMTLAATAPALSADVAAAVKAQEFAHRIVEFAGFDACCKFFREKNVDFNKPTDAGWSLLMRICACGRADLVGYALDATSIVSCATVPNRTTVLHLAAMSIVLIGIRMRVCVEQPQVIQELVATPERRAKLHAIVDSPNINGDTPLMMACVAKHVDAVRALLTGLQANASYGNANGMTALMCAARLSLDPTQEDPKVLMAASSAILRLLLVCEGIHVNASELAAGNTALHFAVLSHNVRGVEALTAEGDIDVTIKNKAGLTPSDLGIKLRASRELMEPLLRKSIDADLKAVERSRELEKELMQAELKESEKKAKKTKKKNAASSSKSSKKAGSNGGSQKEAVFVELASAVHHEDISKQEASPDFATEDSTAVSSEPLVEISSANQEDEDAEDWQPVATKKNRRKLSLSEEKKSPVGVTTETPRPQKASISGSSKTKKKPANSTGLKRSSNGADTPAKPATPPLVSPALVARKAQAKPEILKPKLQKHETQQSPNEPGSPSSAASVSYHKLNAIFHRTFPMADELDIPVESFVIASSSTDIELQPSEDGLSISQLEALQEAHLKAYHYLNEKKMELTRVLEAQRLEAQFALQHEILHLD